MSSRIAELESLLASERIARVAVEKLLDGREELRLQAEAARVEAERERDRWREAAGRYESKAQALYSKAESMREALERALKWISNRHSRSEERHSLVWQITQTLGAEPGDAALTQKEGQGAWRCACAPGATADYCGRFDDAVRGPCECRCHRAPAIAADSAKEGQGAPAVESGGAPKGRAPLAPLNETSMCGHCWTYDVVNCPKHGIDARGPIAADKGEVK